MTAPAPITAHTAELIREMRKEKAAVICLYCDVPATLVTGEDIYPHRPDLGELKFWSCGCGAYVGCHKAGSYRHENGRKIIHTGTEPLGRLANAELRRAKNEAHAVFDPFWKARQMRRNDGYAWLASALRIPVDECHIGMFDVDKCRAVVQAVENANRHRA